MKIIRFLVVLLLAAGMVGNINIYSYAEEEADMPELPKTEEGADSDKESKPGHVTLIFKDADIRTVLHTLSYKSGINIVAASEVEGKVSIRLVDVPWETALEVILKNQGLASERVGNIIRVITLESVTEEELQNRVFVLNYANAKDVAEAVEDTVTERGKVKYDERTNTVIITDIPTNLDKVGSVIERLDRRTPQIVIKANLIETTLDKDENLGIDWTIQANVSGSARPTTLPFERTLSPFARSRGDGTVVQGFGDYLPVGSPDSDPPFPITELPAFPTVSAAQFTFGTLNFNQFNVALEILKSRTDTKIVSQPTITTLNNEEAKVSVSTVFNIPTYERNETTGRMEVTGYSETDIGVILTVVPHVNDAGDIVVDLKPEVSNFLQWDTFGEGDNAIQAPRFSTRSAETQVMVKDGQTIAIGGLMRETATKYKNKVPVLGDIPLLGELFTKTEDGVETIDLLIFVTVELLDENQDDKELMDETHKKAIHSGEDEVSF